MWETKTTWSPGDWHSGHRPAPLCAGDEKTLGEDNATGLIASKNNAPCFSAFEVSGGSVYVATKKI